MGAGWRGGKQSGVREGRGGGREGDIVRIPPDPMTRFSLLSFVTVIADLC